jgi:hypothetical protein
MLQSVAVSATSAVQVGTREAAVQIGQSISDLLASSYAVSADGQRFLVEKSTGATAIAPTTVILNWTEGLGRN